MREDLSLIHISEPTRLDVISYPPLFKQKTSYEMTSSLVGSEMCIRDSFTPVHST
ncbi:hypothetical protein ACX3VG_08620 [Escherichia coli]